jgi:hypothetical protein
LNYEALSAAKPIARHFPGDDAGNERTLSNRLLATFGMAINGRSIALFVTKEHNA